ncbi:MAG: alpha-glucosidase C-terminal domain-containing protein, partial [Gracilimonas sp.]
ASFTVNPGIDYEGESHPRDGFDVRKPNEKERRIQKLVSLFQFTWKGAPMIYYGTESGMWGADDPDDRKPMVWEDLSYEAESHHPYGEERPVDDNNFDTELFEYYQYLADLRNTEPALKHGNVEVVFQNSDQKLVIFTRVYNDENIWVILNRSDNKHEIDLTEWNQNETVLNLLNGISYSTKTISVEPISALILK